MHPKWALLRIPHTRQFPPRISFRDTSLFFMDENEMNPISIPFMTTATTMSSSSCNLSTNPLFSCIITLYILLLLYFPLSLILSISPVLILTSLLLLSLLRLGAVQQTQKNIPKSEQHPEINEKSAEYSYSDDKVERFSLLKTRLNNCVAGIDQNPNRDFEHCFVQWNVKAPLEIIYEAYEGEEEEAEEPNGMVAGPDQARVLGLERYPSLSLCYPETDSDSSSDGQDRMKEQWGAPGSVCFKWEEEEEEEEDREGLFIEIALDSNKKKGSELGLCLDLDSCFGVGEDNLIEIDILRP